MNMLDLAALTECIIIFSFSFKAVALLNVTWCQIYSFLWKMYGNRNVAFATWFLRHSVNAHINKVNLKWE